MHRLFAFRVQNAEVAEVAAAPCDSVGLSEASASQPSVQANAPSVTATITTLAANSGKPASSRARRSHQPRRGRRVSGGRPRDRPARDSCARDRSGSPCGVGSRPRPKARHLDTARPQHSPYREQVGQRPVVERLHVTTKSTFDLGQLRGIAPTSVAHHAAVALAEDEHGSQLPSRSMAPAPFPLRSPRKLFTPSHRQSAAYDTTSGDRPTTQSHKPFVVAMDFVAVETESRGGTCRAPRVSRRGGPHPLCDAVAPCLYGDLNPGVLSPRRAQHSPPAGCLGVSIVG
jgi:hypothetical protein